MLLDRGRAVGVAYKRGGQAMRAHAEREVIVSGGAFNSRQILMLSVIGPANHLRDIGMAPLHDLPDVGASPDEHPNILNIYNAREKIGLTRFLRFDRVMMLAARWFLRHDGQFANKSAAATVVLRTRPELQRPDVRMICMSVSNTADFWCPGLTPPPVCCFSVRVGALHPQSRGWMKLQLADPRDAPHIQFNMFAEQADLDTMIRGVRACRESCARRPRRDMVDHEIAPGAERTSDADLGTFIRAKAGHRSHPVGT